MATNYTKAERISLKTDPTFNERWVQNLISETPAILGLGDLVVRDIERNQPRAGRLDLLLQDPETKRRYEVEIQLGPTDEAHIIRAIEYWDIERKRYPQYEHCAVLIAEEITARFFNVIALFNGTIPLIAIKVEALRVGDHTTLVFTRILDELNRGLVDEDEDAAATPTDRSHWDKAASRQTMQMVDHLFDAVREMDGSLELKFNKFYIGISKDGRAFNFAAFRPRKSTLNLSIQLPRSEEVDKRIDDAGIDTLEYASWGAYRLSLLPEDVHKHRALLVDLLKDAYKLRLPT
jgi:predicted transport protein